MPLSTMYRVNTRYEADTRQAERKVDRLSRKAERHARMVDKAKRAWSTFKKVAGGIAVGAAIFGVAALTRRMVQLTRSAQDAQIQIAAVFEQSNPGRFAANLQRAKGLYDDFQTAAITSPATSAEFLQLFTGAAPGIAPLGLSDKKITQFISRAVPAAKAFTGGDFDQAGRDILQILQGRAGTDVKTYNSLKNRLLELTGAASTEGLNKLAQANPDKVFQALNTSLSSMDVVNQEFAKSFGGLIASATEFGDRFLRAIGGPVLEQMQMTLQKMVFWFQENEKAITRVGEQIGEKFAAGLKVAEKFAKGIAEHFKTILVVGGMIAAKKGFGLAKTGASLMGVGGGGGGGMSVAAAGGAVKKKIGAAGKVAGLIMGKILLRKYAGSIGKAVGDKAMVALGSRFGKTGAVSGKILGGMIGMTGGRGQAMKALGINLGKKGGAGLAAGGLFGKLGGAGLLKIGAVAAGFAKLALAIPAAAIVISMIIGTFRVLKDETNEATIFLKTSIRELMIALDKVAYQFTGGGFVSGLKDFFDWLGTGVVGVLGLAVKAAEQVVQAFSWVVAVFKGFFYSIGELINRVSTGGIMSLWNADFSDVFSRGMKQAFEERAEAERKAYRKRAEEEKKRREEERKKKERDKVTKDGAPGAKVDVTINQEIKTDANPDRIAFRVSEVLGDVAKKFPRAATGVGTR